LVIIEKRLPATHNIVVSGDFHIGSLLTSGESIDEMVEYIRKTPKTYFAGVGDYIEAIAVDDYRFDMRTTKEYDPFHQANDVVDKLRPIKKKILALGTGNHEWKLVRFGDIVREFICDKLQVPYGTYEYVLVIKDEDGNFMYKIFVSHGFRSISSGAGLRRQRRGNEEVQIEKRLREKMGDCLIMCMGHTHRLIVAKPISILHMVERGGKIKSQYTDVHDNGSFIHPEHRWYVNTGSFLKLYHEGVSGYASMAGYDPVDLGVPVIQCVDGKIHNIEKKILNRG